VSCQGAKRGFCKKISKKIKKQRKYAVIFLQLALYQGGCCYRPDASDPLKIISFAL
jgi:hypothetical protein